MTIQIPWLELDSLEFPPAETALEEPNGLLAVGGDLSPQRLVESYSNGIFPWFSDGEPVLWWSPNPRMCLLPGHFKLNRSLKKALKRENWSLSWDCSFKEVIEACSQPRPDQEGTWITEDMKHAYFELHNLGIAHSIEIWLKDELVGGLYGINLGNAFFGESMFSRHSNASKIAFYGLCKLSEAWGIELIDGQVESEHLSNLGFKEIERKQFIETIKQLIKTPKHSGKTFPPMNQRKVKFNGANFELEY